MSTTNYDLTATDAAAQLTAPDLPYQPPTPRSYNPAIGLIGCGGITEQHLTAYRKAGLRVVALCDIVEEAARSRQRAFYPDAQVYRDFTDVLAREDIELVDVAPHPEDRAAILEAAIRAGKHVLSQKPFVVDLGFGRKLVQAAERKGVKLAVNQNGRWAPHVSYMRHAIVAGHIGQPTMINVVIHWNHTWVKGTPFEKIRHLVLYDFAIHWFDMLTCYMGDAEPTQVHAALRSAPGQPVKPGLLAQVIVEYPHALASLTFNAAACAGMQDTTIIAGTQGSLLSTGPSLGEQTVTLMTPQGQASPALEGTWFPDGFRGAMGELLCAVEEDREPNNSAAENLRSLELCFAAIASAEAGRPVIPGKAKKLKASWYRTIDPREAVAAG